MTRVFDRICQVAFQRSVPTEDERRFFLELPQAVEVTNLRMQFTIKKTLGKTPNSCEIMITNLAPRTRNEVEGPPAGLVATISAGHDNVARRMFSGDVVLAFSERDGADWITTLKLSDGGRAFAQARANRSYAPKTPLLTVLKDAAASMGAELPRELLSSSDLRTQNVATGAVMSGPTRDELTRLLAPFGYSWSFQDGKLQVLRDDEVSGIERDLSEDTAMIGSPTFERVKGGKNKAPKTKMRCSAILYPELTPGGVIRVDAREVDGRFKLLEVEHKGDTHGESWTTDIEATEIR